jgi:hypothetical protein
MRVFGFLAVGVIAAVFHVGPARAADAPAEPTSPAVREAKAKYDAAVKRAESELAAAKAAYLEQLDAGVKAAMQAGDLDEANRVDALRKALRAAPAATATAQPPAPAADAGERKPGWVVGSLKDSSGNPIKDVAKYTVNAYGTTLLGGQRSSNTLDVDDDGRFAQELPDGLYAVTAHIVKDFEGVRYRLQLHPDDNKHEQTKLPSKPGIVKNFTWKLTGLRPGYDPKQTFSYYGPYVQVYDARYLGEDEEKLAAEFGQGAKAVVTLTPTTKLIDGSEGKEITIEAPLGEIGQTVGYKALDLPIAVYKVSARVAGKDGRPRPLKVKLEYSAQPADSVVAKFQQASEYDSIKPIQVYLSK